MSVGHEKGCDRTMAKVTRKELDLVLAETNELLGAAKSGVEAVCESQAYGSGRGYAVDVVNPTSGTGTDPRLAGRDSISRVVAELRAFNKGVRFGRYGEIGRVVVIPGHILKQLENQFVAWMEASGHYKDEYYIPHVGGCPNSGLRMSVRGSMVELVRVEDHKESEYHNRRLHFGLKSEDIVETVLGPLCPADMMTILKAMTRVAVEHRQTVRIDMVVEAFHRWSTATTARAETWHRLSIDRSGMTFWLFTSKDGEAPDSLRDQIPVWEEALGVREAIQWFGKNP